MNKLFTSLLIVTLLGSVAVGATRAYFTDFATSQNNTFTAGTIILNPDPNTPGNFIPFAIGNMQPGDGVQNESSFYYRVNLRNDGTLPLRYRVRIEAPASSKNALWNALRVKVGEYSSGPNKVFGTNLTLNDLESGIVIDENVIPTSLDTRVRTVWFRWYLPEGTGNEAQGLLTSFNIIFEATQVNYSGWPN